MAKQKSRIVIEEKNGDIVCKIFQCFSREHAMFMLNKASEQLIYDAVKEKTEALPDDVSELSDGDKEEPKEEEVPAVPEEPTH